MGALDAVAKSVLQWGRALSFEALFWIVALGVVAAMDPEGSGGLNLCLFEVLGLPCPGDGLGRAIAHLARGNWMASWNAHPLAAPVVAGLVSHVVSLVRSSPASSR